MVSHRSQRGVRSVERGREKRGSERHGLSAQSCSHCFSSSHAGLEITRHSNRLQHTKNNDTFHNESSYTTKPYIDSLPLWSYIFASSSLSFHRTPQLLIPISSGNMSIPVVEAYLVPSDTSCDTPAPVQGLASHKQVSRAPTVHPPTEVPPQLHELLDRHTWPIGIKRLFLSNISMYHKRYFILDDSSSMMSNDGERLMGEGKKRRYDPGHSLRKVTPSL